MGGPEAIECQTILIPNPNLPYEQKSWKEYMGWDWTVASKADAVYFARCNDFRETGMSVNEAALLYEGMEMVKPNPTVLELGRDFGTSTRIFLQAIIRRGGELHSMDLKPPHPALVHSLEQLGLDDKVNLITADSMRIGWDKKIDFLLIDTEHGTDNALGEYYRYRNCLEGGAIIAFHDAELPAVKRAIELVKELDNWRFEAEYKNEVVDGFGLHLLRFVG